MIKKLLVPIIFLLVTTIFLRDSIFSQEIVWGQDSPKIIYPFTKLLDKSMKEHKLALWTPDIYFGFPIGSEQGQYGIFYPPNIAHAFLPLQTSLTFLYFIHLFSAGLFTYLLCRQLGIGKFGSTFSGLAFMFNGFIVAHLQYPSHVYAICYLPLSILLLEWGIKKHSLLLFALSGTAIGIGFLTGHPNIPTISAIAVLLYFFFKLIRKEVNILNGLILLVGIMLSSLPYTSQLVTLLPLSIRAGGVTFADATNSSFSFYDFITFIFPNFFFGDLSQTWNFANNWHFWSYWGQVETAGFVGISTIILFIFSTSKIKDTKVLPFLLILIIAFIIALGKNTPIYEYLFKIPVFNGLRAPGKFLFLVDFCLTILAGFGFDVLTKQSLQKTIKLFIIWIIPFIAFSLFTFGRILNDYPDLVYEYIRSHYSKLGPLYNLENFQIFGKVFSYSVNEQTKIGLITVLVVFFVFAAIVLRPKNMILKSLAILVLVIEIMIFASGVNPTMKDSEVFDKNNPVMTQLKTNLGSGHWFYTPNGPWSDYMPNILLSYQIPGASGFASLPLKKYQDWQKTVDNNLTLGDTSLLARSGVSVIYYGNGGQTSLINIKNSWPRAYITTNWIKNDLEEVQTTSTNLNSIKPVKIIEIQSDYLKLESRNENPELLVVNDTFYPGWKAYVNGAETKIYQTNDLFRGVFLDAGENLIEFKYFPKYLIPAVIGSLGWLTFLSIGTVRSLGKLRS